jgi:hypothetical protein
MIPFIGAGINLLSYKFFVGNAIASFLITLYRMHGFPKFNVAYLQRVMLEDSSIMYHNLPSYIASTLFHLIYITDDCTLIDRYLMMATLLLVIRPYFLAAAPILLIEGYPLLRVAVSAFKSRPDLLARIPAGFLDQQLPAVLNRPDWASLSEPARWTIVEGYVQALAATCEVWQGLFFLIELVLPTRSFIATGRIISP